MNKIKKLFKKNARKSENASIVVDSNQFNYSENYFLGHEICIPCRHVAHNAST